MKKFYVEGYDHATETITSDLKSLLNKQGDSLVFSSVKDENGEVVYTTLSLPAAGLGSGVSVHKEIELIFPCGIVIVLH